MKTFKSYIIENKSDIDTAVKIFDALYSYVEKNYKKIEKEIKNKNKSIEIPVKNFPGFKIFIDQSNKDNIAYTEVVEDERGNIIEYNIHFPIIEDGKQINYVLSDLEASKDVFIHEFTHYLDHKIKKIPFINYPSRPNRKNYDSQTQYETEIEEYYKKYYNHPYEINANFNRFLYRFLYEYFVFLPENIKQKLLSDFILFYKKFKMSFDSEWNEYLTKENKFLVKNKLKSVWKSLKNNYFNSSGISSSDKSSNDSSDKLGVDAPTEK